MLHGSLIRFQYFAVQCAFVLLLVVETLMSKYVI
jgi:hypothetical protein